MGYNPAMRAPGHLRSLAVLVAAVLASSCGSSPTTADPSPVPITTGPQVLRIGFIGPLGSCPLDQRSFFPTVYTRVIVSRTGNEWVGTPGSAASGDVEVRFRQSGAAVIAGSMPVSGSIKGTAVHLPELLSGLPAAVRVAFGSDGHSTFIGFAFTASAIATGAGLDGTGTGPITFSDDAGHSCTATTFSWSMAAQ
jgi:hypothetical protein